MKLSEAKHAFITGGASGLGLGIADALAAQGLVISVADIDADSLARVCADRGDRFQGIVLDTRDREGWKAAKAQAEAAFGPVDILVNNAGIAPDGKGFAEMDPASFDRILAINLTGVFNGVQCFAADMSARGKGHIVNTSSQAGLVANMPTVGAYSVAKFGVTALSESLRSELLETGVKVSVLCPGYVTTNLGANTDKLSGSNRSGAVVIPQSALTADHVGAMVVKAIANDEPFIVTHPRVWQSLEKRNAEIERACELAEQRYRALTTGASLD